MDPHEGGIRRALTADGRPGAQTHTPRFFSDVQRIVREYVASRPEPAVYEFLALDFDGLTKRHGGVAGTVFRDFPAFPQRYRERLAGRKALCFCADVAHAQAVAEAFVRAGIPSAAVTGETVTEAQDPAAAPAEAAAPVPEATAAEAGDPGPDFADDTSPSVAPTETGPDTSAICFRRIGWTRNTTASSSIRP